jgi:hypothetical protein
MDLVPFNRWGSDPHNFSVREGGNLIAELRISSDFASAEITIGDCRPQDAACRGSYTVTQKSWEWDAPIHLTLGGTQIASAKKEHTFSRSFRITYGDQIYRISPRWFLSGKHQVLWQGELAGSIDLTLAFFIYNRNIRFDFPNTLSLPLQLFMVYLPLGNSLRRREASGDYS